MSIFNRIERALLTVAAAMAVIAAPAAARADEPSYEMRAYTNQPGGIELLAGDYDAAIDAAAGLAGRGDSESRLGASTNLCVAYTVTRALEAAEAACAEALDLAERADAGMRLTARRGDETAKALINRGVLRAVTGDPAAAASDFRAASAAGAEHSAATRNLAYLETATTYSAAIADAALD